MALSKLCMLDNLRLDKIKIFGKNLKIFLKQILLLVALHGVETMTLLESGLQDYSRGVRWVVKVVIPHSGMTMWANLCSYGIT